MIVAVLDPSMHLHVLCSPFPEPGERASSTATVRPVNLDIIVGPQNGSLGWV